MIDFIQDKVDSYCNNKKEKEIEFSLYDVEQMLKREKCFWKYYS